MGKASLLTAAVFAALLFAPVPSFKVEEYEVAYTDIVPKDNQAITTRKAEEDRPHEVILLASSSQTSSYTSAGHVR